MKNHLKHVVLATAFASATLASADTLSGQHSLAFKANFTVQEMLFPGSSASCQMTGMSLGRGSASYVGNAMLTATDCVQAVAGYFNFSGGKLTLTAANGDTVTALYGGSLIPTQNGSSYALNGWLQITGGTGRFAGARGAGQLNGVETLTFSAPPTPPSATGTLEMSGTISY